MENLLGQSISSALPSNNFPYTQQWNLSVSHETKGDFMAEVGYAGSIGTHLPISGANAGDYNLDELSNKYYSLGNALLNTNAVVNGTTMTLGQSLRPYPAYLNFENTAEYNGSTTYHSLQAKAQKRFASGGMIMANYTWAKIIGDTDTLNPGLEPKAAGNVQGGAGFIQDFNNLKGERSILSFNTPQRLVVDYIVDLPFGKDRAFAHFGGIAGAAVSGWAVNGITTFQTGFPLAMSMTGNALTEDFGAGTLRPNYTSGCNKKISGPSTSRMNEWFNTSCFTSPGNFALGNEPRVDGALHSQGIANYDFSAMKSTKIWERANLQFRTEFFNIFNHTQFNPPATSLDGGNFGQILSQQNQPRLIQVSLRLNY
jgi:hypothetical protein